MRKLNKRILAFALVAVMAISTVMSVMASTGTGEDTDIATGFSARTGEVTISGDFTLTYTFTNTSTGTANWENFILEMHNEDYVYVDVRADNYGWLANQADGDYITFGDGSADWDAWNATMAAGSECTVTVEKTGADIVITVVAAGETFTATAYVAEYEDADITVYLTGENVSLTDVSYSYTQPADDVEVTTGFSAHTGEVTLSGDFVLTYTFTNTSTGTSNWENFILEMHDDNYVYVDVRADNYGWLANQADGDYITFGDGSADWDAWNAAMAAGSECTVTVEKTGANIVITVVAAGETFNATAYVAEYEDADLIVYLTGENVTLTNVSYTYDPEDALVVEEETTAEEETTTEAAEEETTATEAETTTSQTAVVVDDEVEKETVATATDGTSISYTVTEEVTVSETADDIDIADAFSAHTGEVTISGDFTLEYTFTNTSTGSSNWENFILEMVADGVYLDVRADNYGWFAFADENDTLEFGDGAADWDVWNAAMAAGSKCTVTVVKEGANIYITIVAGGETFTATAYVSEYEDAALTIYLTGENVSLTNVSYTYTYTTTTTKTDTYSEVVEISDVVITIESMSDGVDENAVVNYDVYELSEDEQAALEALWEGALSYDVLDIYLTVDGELYEIPDGESIQLRISYSCDSSYETALVLHYVDEDGEWHVIVPDEVGDGYILATFTSLSPVALIVGSSESETETTTSEDENNTDSEEDASTASGGSAVAGGDTATWTYFVMIVAAAAVCVVLAKKRVTE